VPIEHILRVIRNQKRCLLKLFVTLLILGLSISCTSATEEGSSVKTDLGSAGNSEAKKRYDTYLNTRQLESSGCLATGTGLPRVIISGFGLFSGVTSNISGAVTNTMADERYFSGTSSEEGDSNVVEGMVAGRIAGSDSSVKTVVRTITYNDVKFEACFLTLDVIWDLAAAIIINEARSFDPDLIVMSGLDGSSQKTVTVEGGAINNAVAYHSFDSNGNVLEVEPVTDRGPILPIDRNGVEPILPMTWNSSRIGTKITDKVSELNSSYSVRIPGTARDGNDYICNNVSYSVLAAMKGVAIDLAGGEITFPSRKQKARAGFFHYPASSKNVAAEVAQWADIIAELVVSEIAN